MSDKFLNQNGEISTKQRNRKKEEKEETIGRKDRNEKFEEETKNHVYVSKRDIGETKKEEVENGKEEGQGTYTQERN